jgi:hypothetical protein
LALILILLYLNGYLRIEQMTSGAFAALADPIHRAIVDGKQHPQKKLVWASHHQVVFSRSWRKKLREGVRQASRCRLRKMWQLQTPAKPRVLPWPMGPSPLEMKDRHFGGRLNAQIPKNI